jgi:hypothetical protein
MLMENLKRFHAKLNYRIYQVKLCSELQDGNMTGHISSVSV